MEIQGLLLIIIIYLKGLCDGGFGNPSGHSLVSAFIYLKNFIWISFFYNNIYYQDINYFLIFK